MMDLPCGSAHQPGTRRTMQVQVTRRPNRVGFKVRIMGTPLALALPRGQKQPCSG